MSQEDNTVVTLESSSLNSNQVPLNGNYRHLENDQSTQEKADVLFKKNDPHGSEILAPMVRASTTPLRTLALSYGCDIVYTEEIIDRAITSTERCYNEHLKTIDYKKKMENFTAKVQKRLKKYDEESPKAFLRISPSIERNKLVYQMGTGEPELALPAAMMIQNDVDCLDINMGCPKKFSVSGGMGSALLSDLPRACSIVSTLRKYLTIPVTCKIRLLSDTKKTCDFVEALVKAGANAIAIHGREVGDQSQQRAKWDRLCDVVKILTSSANTNVPIIINGDLYTRNDIVNLRRRSGAHGVMLARPALYNTSIFRKPNYEELEPLEDGIEETRFGYDSPLLTSKTKVIQEYLEHATLFQANTKNVKYVICEMMNNRRTPTQLAHFMPQSYTNGQAISQVCRCHTMADLCKIWDVSHSSVSTVSQDSDQVHVYDDRYFLDPEALHKEREIRLGNHMQHENISNKKARIDD